MKKTILSTILSVACATASYSTDLTQGQLNEIADESALSSYAAINKNWGYRTNFFHSMKTDANEWEAAAHTNLNGLNFIFKWNQEKQPNYGKALTSILHSKTVAECATASDIARMKIIYDILGNYNGEVIGKAITQAYGSEQACCAFLPGMLQTKCEEDFKGTGFYGFINLPQYGYFKPQGSYRNHNVIRLSNGKFIGFDPGFFTEPKTYQELEEHMYKAFIRKKYVALDKVAEHEEFCKNLNFYSYRLVRGAYQVLTTKPYRFNVRLINHFKETGKFIY